MKLKSLFMMVLLTIAGQTFADDNLSVADVPMNAGETKQFAVNLVLSSETYSAMQFDLVLPKGISIPIKNNKLQIALSNDHRTYDDFEEQYSHSLASNQTATDEYSTTYTVVIYDANQTPLKEGSGPIVKVNIAADESLNGDLTAYVKNIMIAASGGSGGVTGGTTLTNASFTITVAGKPTVTADDKSRAYGDANPELTYTVSGGTITGTPTLSTTATPTSNVGEYPITVAANDEYNTAPGTLTVTAAPLTINGGTYTIKQGEALPTFAAVYTGFKNNETSTVLTSQPVLTLEDGVTGASAPGTYTITVTGGEATNYAITRENGTLTITDADPVTVKATNYTITYGDALPDYGYTTEGADLSGVPSISCTATATSGAGTYPITITTGTVSNYNVTYVNGTLTINKAPLTITAENKSKTYGDANPDFTCAYNGFVNDETSAVLTTQPTLATEATVASGVGTYDITASGAAAANYEISYAKGTLTIGKAPLTAKAKDKTVEQGVATPTLEIEYTGFKNNETDAVLTTKPTISTTRELSSEPGKYPITVTGGAATNYDITCQNGILTVTLPDLITVTVTNAERYYGAENPTFAYTVSGGTLTGEPVLSCTATKTSASGEYDITIEKGTISNYNVSLVGGKLTVNKVPLTITPENKSKAYGEDNPTLTYTCSGFVNDETSAVLTTQPTLSTEATATSGIGTYDITASGAAADNYEISYAKGTLTVGAKNITLTITLTPDPTVYTYDGTEKEPTVSVSAEGVSTLTVGTDYELTGTLSAVNANGYTITATPKGNYSGNTVTASWTINPKTSIDDDGNTIVEDGNNVTLTNIGDDAVGADGGLTIPDGVTQIDDNAFAGMTDEEKGAVTYVDLTNTNVSGLTVDRENGVFAGFDDNTLIFLPSGNNDGGEPNVVIGSSCSELVLDDDKDIVLPIDFTAEKVTYNRTLSAADDAYTTCLPFSQSSNENVKFYELSSSTNDNLVFTEVNATEANKPYLAVPTVANVSLSKQTSTVIKKNSDFDGSEKAVTGYKMLGTMKRISRDDAMGFYILQDGNEWHPVGASSPATVSIPPYRAYIVGVTGSARLLTVLGDDATSIKTIKTINADGSEQWYDMNGRKLSGMPDGKGAYIMNGKKVIMK